MTDEGVADAFTRMRALLREVQAGTPSSFADGLAPLPVASSKAEDVARWAARLADEEPELDSPPLATLNDLARFFQHDRRSE